MRQRPPIKCVDDVWSPAGNYLAHLPGGTWTELRTTVVPEQIASATVELRAVIVLATPQPRDFNFIMFRKRRDKIWLGVDKQSSHRRHAPSLDVSGNTW